MEPSLIRDSLFLSLRSTRLRQELEHFAPRAASRGAWCFRTGRASLLTLAAFGLMSCGGGGEDTKPTTPSTVERPVKPVKPVKPTASLKADQPNASHQSSQNTPSSARRQAPVHTSDTSNSQNSTGHEVARRAKPSRHKVERGEQNSMGGQEASSSTPVDRDHIESEEAAEGTIPLAPQGTGAGSSSGEK